MSMNDDVQTFPTTLQDERTLVLGLAIDNWTVALIDDDTVAWFGKDTTSNDMAWVEPVLSECKLIFAALEAMPPEQWYWDEETEGFQRRYAPGGVYIGDAEDVSELNPHARRLWAHDLHLTAYRRAA